MPHDRHAACIQACNACAEACGHCASACLREPDPKPMARCIALDVDCAEICRVAAAFMSRDSQFTGALCAICADVCETCGAECAKHDMEHCKRCAEACRKCAQECRRMAPASRPGAAAQPQRTSR